MYILGVNAYHGDSSACLLKNGVIVAAIEEERIRRIKHWAGFPSESIKFCLKYEGISLNKVDYITISRDPKANFYKKLFYALRSSVKFTSIMDRVKNHRRINLIENDFSSFFDVSLIQIKKRIYNIEHHRSHIASAFFASRFNKSAIISIDGFGDFTSTMTAIGEGNSFKVLDEVNFPHSLGVFYTSVTQFLGFLNYGDEYKVMGLSSYGKPVYLDCLKEIVYMTSDGFFKLNKKYFKHFQNGINMSWENGMPYIDKLYTKKWIDLFGEPRLVDDKLEQRHINLACSVQRYIEKIIFKLLNNLHYKTGVDNICVTGGVAQNSVVNGKILSNTNFNNIYIPSAGHDSGTAIGSALFLYNQILEHKRLPEIKTAYFGNQYSTNEITTLLKEREVEYKFLSDELLFDYVADKIISGGVIGWFQGRSEFGPRALGHRSIIVDPRRKDAKELLNKKIKMRESFRPFAPSILSDKIQEYFMQDVNVPFMEQVFDIKVEKQKEIPAVTHVDGTGRLQSVDKKISPKFYKLISAFAKKTGVPILLNTSFNENEPIVNEPIEALECFLRTEMDVLVMENIIIER